MQTTYRNQAFVLLLTEAGTQRTYSVHHRLPFNEYDEEVIATGSTPSEAAHNADKALGWA